MKLFVFSLAACVAVGLSGLSPGARADEPGKQANADPAKEFAAIKKDWSDAQQAFSKAYQEAKPAEQEALLDKQPQPAAYADRCLKLAETHPDSPVAVEAWAWVVANAPGTPQAKKAIPGLNKKVAAITDLGQLQKTLTQFPPYGVAELAPQVAQKVRQNLDHPQALALLLWVGSATQYGGTPELAKLYNDTVDLLMERFVDRRQLAPLADWLRRDDDPSWAEKHLRRLADKNPSEQIKSQARYALAMVLKNKDEESQPEAEKLLEAAIADLSKPTQQGPAEKRRLTEARKELADMKLHGLGKPAPEISALDLEGKGFKLSDYKGKVVLLDFWGNW